MNLGVASSYICEAKCDDMPYKRKQSLIFILIIKKAVLNKLHYLKTESCLGKNFHVRIYFAQDP